MGTPKIDISFEQLTSSVVVRSQRGIVALLLPDETVDGRSIVTITRDADILASDWTGESENNIKLALRGGAAKVLAVRLKKTAGEDDYESTLASISAMKWNWLAIPYATSAQVSVAIGFIKQARSEGKLFKLVCASTSSPDCEGIVNFATQGIVSDVLGASKTYSAAEYSVKVAGMLAGIALDRSITGMAFTDVLYAEENEDVSAQINAGKFVLMFNGEAYEAARGVTSLINTGSVPSLFKKIKHVEGCDMIGQDFADIFKEYYKGTRLNNHDNKQSLCAALTGYLKKLNGTVLSGDFENVAAIDIEAQRTYLELAGIVTTDMQEIDIARANTGEHVFILANIQLVDAMEDVIISVVLN